MTGQKGLVLEVPGKDGGRNPVIVEIRASGVTCIGEGVL